MTIDTIDTQKKTDARLRSSTEILGRVLGIPVKVNPWWGSAWKKDEKTGKATLICPASYDSNQLTRPVVRNGRIVLWEGQCHDQGWIRPHTHVQTLEVKSMDPDKQAMLISIRNGPNYTQYLIGIDGRSPYAVTVNRSLKTVEEAFNWLIPKFVREAVAQGLNVKRQGDWYFVPTKRKPIERPNGGVIYSTTPTLNYNKLYKRGAFLLYNYTQTRHRGAQVCYQSIAGLPGPAPLVKGKVTAPDHKPIFLEGWHIGVRNRSTPWRNTAGRQRLKDD